MAAIIQGLASVGMAFIFAVTVASCGDSSKHAATASSAPSSIPSQGPLPNGVVAAVQSSPITSASFQHWLEIAYNEIWLLPSHQALPSPPAYATCVATLHAQSGLISKEPTATLRSQCAQKYALARSDAIGFLIRAQWLLQEGDARHVSIANATVSKSVAQEIQKQHPGPGTFKMFLAKTGMTPADFSFRIRLNTIADTLQSNGNPPVTVSPAQIARYYRAHLSEYTIPPRRQTLVVETYALSAALTAKAALQSGQKWSTVAKRYSIDFSKLIGGVFTVTKGEQDPRLVHAVFSAPRAHILGPVRVPGPNGSTLYYVFKVTGSTPASQQALGTVAAQIRQQLTLRLQQESATSFIKSYRKHWKARTRCRIGYVVSECRTGGSLSTGI
jgi:foldase protein PrsA